MIRQRYDERRIVVLRNETPHDGRVDQEGGGDKWDKYAAVNENLNERRIGYAR